VLQLPRAGLSSKLADQLDLLIVGQSAVDQLYTLVSVVFGA